jgi:hypothetical protein
MRARPFLIAASAAGLVLCGVGVDRALAARATSHASSPGMSHGTHGKAHHVYRLDYVLTTSSPGKAPESTAMSLELEDGSGGDLRAGANVPLSTGAGSMMTARQDVGLRVSSNVVGLGGEALLHVNLELSGPDDRGGDGPRTIRKVTSSGDALVVLDKQAVVTIIEEPVTRAHYELAVTATKLR